ncbi:hypothetical protein [Ruegeria profundi]|uniref:Translocase n=1 Tax=Ruegeria profundi TaxID=1685378 RepID=A0A0X3TNL6_9RHOB|nr:hypothetical protein [Ruegeria profundi]KUJ77362.1 hypothetical protein AVO44_17350 [Ruegeria profundi]
MFVIKNYVTTGGTVVCALAIGYLMQNGLPVWSDPAQGSDHVAINQNADVSGLEGIVLTSSTPAYGTRAHTTSVPRTLQPNRSTPSDRVDCSVSARAYAVPGAAAQLRVKAPCHGNQRVEVHHSGLTVTQLTDEHGALTLTVPALSEYAIFLISFEDQKGTVATTHVPDLGQYSRVAVQWQGEADLQIHALEFGASYGDVGHVSSDADAQGTGNVVHMAQPAFADARNVEIYSFPAAQTDRSGSIELTVEAEVTPESCGRDLNIQLLDLRDGQSLQSRDLMLNFPDCSRTGEFLVLNNLFQNLTIAAN